MIHRFRDRYPVQALCALLNVSRSGYYKWLSRQGRPDKDEPIAKLIMQCQEKVHKTYGYRRVKFWLLRETGLVINHKAVLRITRKYGLQAVPKRKRFRYYDLNTYHHYENLLHRDFRASRPNEKWVTDISYIPTGEGFLYVKAKLFCPEIAGLFCRIAGLFCHDSRANLSLKPVCFGIAIS